VTYRTQERGFNPKTPPLRTPWWTEGLQKVVRWLPEADDNPDSHQTLIITF